jgi:non-specific serine/threonine protein kinase
LLAAAESLRATMGVARPAAECVDYEQALALSRGRLSDAAFAAAASAGRAMTLDEAVKDALVAPPAPTPPGARPTPAELTAREAEVAALIGRGFSNREIAAALVLAERTVEAHVTHVLNKLGLRSRAQIAVWATQRGLLLEPAVPSSPPAHP